MENGTERKQLDNKDNLGSNSNAYRIELSLLRL